MIVFLIPIIHQLQFKSRMYENKVYAFIIILVLLNDINKTYVTSKLISFVEYFSFNNKYKANIIDVPCKPGKAKDLAGNCRKIVTG